MYHILIVDDSLVMRRAISGCFEKLGIPHDNLVAAEDGRQGLAALEQRDFDLIFTDVNMPGMDGVEFIRLVREKNQQVPIITVTSEGVVETLHTVISAGSSGMVRKSVFLKLMANLNSLVAGS